MLKTNAEFIQSLIPSLSLAAAVRADKYLFPRTEKLFESMLVTETVEGVTAEQLTVLQLLYIKSNVDTLLKVAQGV